MTVVDNIAMATANRQSVVIFRGLLTYYAVVLTTLLVLQLVPYAGKLEVREMVKLSQAISGIVHDVVSPQRESVTKEVELKFTAPTNATLTVSCSKQLTYENQFYKLTVKEPQLVVQFLQDLDLLFRIDGNKCHKTLNKPCARTVDWSEGLASMCYGEDDSFAGLLLLHTGFLNCPELAQFNDAVRLCHKT